MYELVMGVEEKPRSTKGLQIDSFFPEPVDAQFTLVVLKNPLVVLTGLCLFLGRHFGQSKNLSNLFGVLSSQLEGNLEAGQIQKFLDPHEVGGRQQIKQHVVASQLVVVHEFLVPFLVHDLFGKRNEECEKRRTRHCHREILQHFPNLPR